MTTNRSTGITTALFRNDHTADEAYALPADVEHVNFDGHTVINTNPLKGAGGTNPTAKPRSK